MLHWAGNLDERIETTADYGLRRNYPFGVPSPRFGFAGSDVVPGPRPWEHTRRWAPLDALANESSSEASDIRALLDRRLAAGQIDGDTHARLAREAEVMAAALAAGEDSFADGGIGPRPDRRSGPGRGASRFGAWIRHLRVAVAVALAVMLVLMMAGFFGPLSG